MANTPERITKSFGDGSFDFYTNGSRLRVVLGGLEILGLFERRSGGIGRTHLGFPNFDDDPAGLLKKHGLSRDRQLTPEEIIEQAGNSLRTRVLFEFGETPSRLLLTTEYAVIPDQFYLDTDVVNVGSEPAPELLGFHPYFTAPLGYTGTIFNGQDISKEIRTDGLIVPIKAESELIIPGQPKLYVIQDQLPVANGWVGIHEQGIPDPDYLALSLVSANFRDPEQRFRSPHSVMQPGEHRHYRLVIVLAT